MKIKCAQPKIGKRTFTLKELAQRNFNPALESQIQKSELTNGLSGQLCLSQIEEDLLDPIANEKSTALPNGTKPKDLKI